ncbi:MAG: glycosyltransferase [Chloroflexota bacterium]|nr:glycosyltransferase [Dehalococcoidia bacterium]MDW8255242.1 glycosyltransferase [Chloroflexota bacterium]
MRVSLCLTVLNEARSIDELLESVRAQTRPPDEIVIADGGSRDGTVERIRAYCDRLPIRLLVVPGTISAGRNAAIRAATGDLIAVTDAGVRLAPGWLADLIAAIEKGADVAAGFFLPDPRTTFEVAMGAAVLPEARDIDPARFLPSSRSIAFRRAVWEQVGGYPEWLDYCEDLVFDFAYRRAGFRQVWVPSAVAHFRPRGSLRAFWLQYFRYARGDGKADLWRKRHAVRYLTYGVAAPALLAAGRRSPLAWLLLLAGFLAYLWTPLRRYRRQSAALSLGERLRGLLWLPVIRVVGDLAKMAGYPVGIWWRLRRPRRR